MQSLPRGRGIPRDVVRTMAAPEAVPQTCRGKESGVFRSRNRSEPEIKSRGEDALGCRIGETTSACLHPGALRLRQLLARGHSHYRHPSVRGGRQPGVAPHTTELIQPLLGSFDGEIVGQGAPPALGSSGIGLLRHSCAVSGPRWANRHRGAVAFGDAGEAGRDPTKSEWQTVAFRSNRQVRVRPPSLRLTRSTRCAGSWPVPGPRTSARNGRVIRRAGAPPHPVPRRLVGSAGPPSPIVFPRRTWSTWRGGVTRRRSGSICRRTGAMGGVLPDGAIRGMFLRSAASV